MTSISEGKILVGYFEGYHGKFQEGLEGKFNFGHMTPKMENGLISSALTVQLYLL